MFFVVVVDEEMRMVTGVVVTLSLSFFTKKKAQSLAAQNKKRDEREIFNFLSAKRGLTKPPLSFCFL